VIICFSHAAFNPTFLLIADEVRIQKLYIEKNSISGN
jgi:hypothetical protein